MKLFTTLKNIWRMLRGEYWRVVPNKGDGWCVEYKRTKRRQFEHLAMNRAQAVRTAKLFNT